MKQTLAARVGLTLSSKQWQIETGKDEPPSKPLVHTAHTSSALREVDAESGSAKEKQCGFFFFSSFPFSREYMQTSKAAVGRTHSNTRH